MLPTNLFQKCDQMCGILGIIGKINKKDKISAGRMAKAMERRGPDGEAFFESDDAVLGSRRLAIVDIEKGIQPMSSGNLTIIFNGEIYNHKELRERLEAERIEFKTCSDTEVLLKLFEKYGKECLEMLDGQFAFAIWDSSEKELFLARDRFGEKPLHYTRTKDGDFIFASMPGAILEHRKVNAEPDLYSLGFFILQSFTFAAGDAPLDRSFFKEIKELPPGHLMTVSGKDQRIEEWYRFETKEKEFNLEEAAAKVRKTLEHSIRKRVADEVRTGVALSGGIDSSIVAAIARDEDEKITASCISFDGDENDDLVHARLLAEEKYILLSETATTPERIRGIIDEMVDAMDAPHCMIRQIGMLANYRKLAEAGVKVALVGEGADELFFGYYHKFPGFKADEKAISETGTFREICGRRLDATRAIFTEETLGKMDFEHMIDSLSSKFEDFNSKDARRKTQNFYLNYFLSTFLIRANDRLGMYSSIEVRLPFLSKDMVELASEISPLLNIEDENEKRVLREAFRDILPKDIAERRKAPLPAAVNLHYHWEILAFLRDSIKEADPAVWKIFRKERIEEMCNEFEQKLNSLKDGAELVKFRPLAQEFQTLTIHMFSMLTILRWHKRYLSEDKTGEFQKLDKNKTSRYKKKSIRMTV